MAGERGKEFGNRWLITAHTYNTVATSSGATYAICNPRDNCFSLPDKSCLVVRR